MKYVIKEELVVMDGDSDCCVLELLDVWVDVFGYVCLVVIMSMGCGYYSVFEQCLYQCIVDNGGLVFVVISVGVLVDGLYVIGVKKVFIFMFYMKLFM